jgi:hypothetical protein
MSIDEWVELFIAAGFSNIKYEQFNDSDNWAGTLIISGSY